MSEIEVGFDDLTVLSEGDADVFVLNFNGEDGPPPYYVTVNGRRFSFTGDTFLIFGHSASLSSWVREQEAEGMLVLLGERDDRYLRYVHDPAAELEEAEEAAAAS
ncbi:MAG: hypothetical protein F4X25_07395 [Chloroflexi bacterium]|nr:hypothetical protein [Chloroflexota bacterium]